MNKLKYGTHNSATSESLIWWQKPFNWLNRLTSKCQSLSIEEQYNNNVRVFNFQVCYYKKEWYISHGLFIYNIKLLDILKYLKEKSSSNDIIYFQLYLDKSFIVKQNEKEFKVLLELIKAKYLNNGLKLLIAWVEGKNDEILYRENININLKEYYWTTNWANKYAKNILDKLPLPKRWAKKNNNKIVLDLNTKYLMLDFVEFYDGFNSK